MPPPAPLAPMEMEGLWRWERQVSWCYVLSMAAFLAASLVAYRFGEIAWLQGPLLVGALVLVTIATVLQFRARCPRCAARLRAGILRTLPGKCAACGVDFPRPPAAGS